MRRRIHEIWLPENPSIFLPKLKTRFIARPQSGSCGRLRDRVEAPSSLCDKHLGCAVKTVSPLPPAGLQTRPPHRTAVYAKKLAGDRRRRDKPFSRPMIFSCAGG